jgi:pimeloyl-ACP methyl ester carboxylesterase
MIRTSSLLIATCRADPDSADIHNHVPLPAGEYRVLIVDHDAVDGGPRHCQTCETAPGFTIREQLSKLPDGDVVLVVHGFNCTEVSGIETAWNVRDALAAWGVPVAAVVGHAEGDETHVIAFTWPCEHTLLPGYMSDKEAVARFAAFSLANLLHDLRTTMPSRRVHIIAHSMGCFLTLKALNLLAVLHGEFDPHVPPLVQSVIWLAPDINADALERSTPGSPRQGFWHTSTPFHALRRFALRFRRPRPEPARPVAHSAAPVTSAQVRGQHAPAGDHPLDGFGYATLNVMHELAIYSSLRDEAMWASPLANRATEESGSVAGNVRLGWCGPLHPGLMMEPDPGALNRPRTVALVECSAVVTEHGGYFFDPVVQRDIASRISAAQAQSRPGISVAPRRTTSRRPTRPRTSSPASIVAPPPERIALIAWHAGSRLSYPAGTGKSLAQGLALWELRLPDLTGDGATCPQDGAPVVEAGSITARFAGLWRFGPTRVLLAAWVGVWRRWYGV